MAGQNDTSNDGMLLTVCIVVLIALIWWVFHDQLSMLYMGTKKAEYWLLKLTLMDKIFPETWAMHVAPVEHYLTNPPRSFKFKELTAVGKGIGFFSRFFYMILLAVVGWHVFKKNPAQKFVRTHNMDSLVRSEQELWPAIKPVVGLNLIDEDINKGPWAMAKKPWDFALYYRLVDENKKLNRDRAEKLFAMQLGKLWNGSAKLPNYVQALFACFAAHACGDTVAAHKGLDMLSNSMSKGGKEDYSWVPELLQKYENNPIVTEVVKKHAYVYTVMPAMLKKAREYGVLQSPKFIWLRPKNRPLWYILNGVGHRVAFAEVGGIYAHWIAEEVTEHAIERPYVIKAVDGLEKSLLEIKVD